MRLFLSILVLAALLVTSLLLFEEVLEGLFGGEKALDWLRERADWGWLAAIGLIAADLVLPVPGTAILTALGAQYGTVLGGLVGAVGMIIAGCIAYGLCRAFGDRGARLIVGDKNLPGVTTWFHRWGGFAVAASRALPLLPEVISCLAGVVRMPFPRFLVAVALGSVVVGLAFAGFGDFAGERIATATVISVVVPFMFWPLLRVYFKRIEERERSEVEQA